MRTGSLTYVLLHLLLFCKSIERKIEEWFIVKQNENRIVGRQNCVSHKNYLKFIKSILQLKVTVLRIRKDLAH